jgi:dUTPase
MTRVSPSIRPPLILTVKLVHPEAITPRRFSTSSPCWDLAACLISETGASRQLVLPPRESRSVPCGISVSPPSGCFCAIISKASLAKGHEALWVTDAPAFTTPNEELHVLLYNGGNRSHYITHGQWIAHLLLLPLVLHELVVVT